jgi:hypothetical protein
MQVEFIKNTSFLNMLPLMVQVEFRKYSNQKYGLFWCRWSSENTLFKDVASDDVGEVHKIFVLKLGLCWCRWSSEKTLVKDVASDDEGGVQKILLLKIWPLLMQVEFRKYLLFGFIEGIWYLDIIYQGERPGQVRFNFTKNNSYKIWI